MPTNEQRRATARRKLERQLERRAQQARRRRMLVIVGAPVAAVVVVAAVVFTVFYTNHEHKNTQASASASTTASAAAGSPSDIPPLPPFKPVANLGANCQYVPSAEPASKPVKPPRQGKVPTDPAQVSVSMMTDQGPVGLLLANNESPCTVNSFVSLAQQKFFDNTRCHRLTASPTSAVVQCGDPTADGTGGPGYQFANEYPSNLYTPDDPTAHEPVIYPRGTLAMANAGPNTNGSQFFMVYKDTQLPPEYTVFGKIQQDGLATLDKIAKGGVAGGGQDGQPATPVTIKSVRLD
ncbi:peptidylprolyl isomerase [Mycobacterium sp.]|uniref:peptidylprolyl isomerase n=1 Tax=Mycobacterium sp. TaxID=1785 RepID=UPI003C78671B